MLLICHEMISKLLCNLTASHICKTTLAVPADKLTDCRVCLIFFFSRYVLNPNALSVFYTESMVSPDTLVYIKPKTGSSLQLLLIFTNTTFSLEIQNQPLLEPGVGRKYLHECIVAQETNKGILAEHNREKIL